MGLENGAWCTEEGSVKAAQSPMTGSPCTSGVHGKNKLHAPRVAGAVVIVPCRDAKGGSLFALYIPTVVMENYGLIYWQEKKCKHCIAEMPFASWIVFWCLLFKYIFCIHQNKSRGWIPVRAFTTHWRLWSYKRVSSPLSKSGGVSMRIATKKVSK